MEKGFNEQVECVQDSCYNMTQEITIGLGYRQTPNKNGWIMKIEDLKACVNSDDMKCRIQSGQLLIQYTYYIDENRIPHNVTDNMKNVIGKVTGIDLEHNTATIRLNNSFLESNDINNMELFFGYKCDMSKEEGSNLEIAKPRYIEYAALQDKKESNYE